MTKYILATLIAVSGLSFGAFAADEEHAGSTTVDHSKNPITGTKKTTVKHKWKEKNADGSEAKMKQTDTTKEMKDGKTEHSSKKETESESK